MAPIRHRWLPLCLLLTVLWVASAAARTPAGPEQTNLFLHLQKLLKAEQWDEAVRLIEQPGEPLRVAERYEQMVNDLYWKAKALSHTVRIGRAGMDYLQKAIAQANDETAQALRVKLRIVSYNVASYAWPGWDEPGIAVTAADRAAGLAAAKIHVAVVEKLVADQKTRAAAQWVLGAQYLAASQTDPALTAFAAAQRHAAASGDVTQGWLFYGYQGITRLAAGRQVDEGRAMLARARRALTDHPGEYGVFYIQQLDTAGRVFAPPPKTAGAI